MYPDFISLVNNKNFRPIGNPFDSLGHQNSSTDLCRQQIDVVRSAGRKLSRTRWPGLFECTKKLSFIIMECTEHAELASRFQTQESFPVCLS